MRDYIDHKTDFGRCYSKTPNSPSFLDWNLDTENNNTVHIIRANSPLYDVIRLKETFNNNWVVTYHILPSKVSELEFQFNQLANKWKGETGLFSIDRDRVNDTFLDIISLGKEIIPLILKDMQTQNGTARWHIALKALAKTNPVPNEDLNKSKLVKERWIKWGKDNGLI